MQVIKVFAEGILFGFVAFGLPVIGYIIKFGLH